MLTADAIAQICHEANRAYYITIEDHSLPRWEDAPEWQLESAIRGVIAVMEAPTLTPAELHAAWMADKVAQGWVWGPIKDAEAKTHPNLVPYEELAESQRRKDHLFRGIVLALWGDL